MKRILFFLTILSALLVSSCELIDDNESDVFEPDQADESGNLLIINNSGEQLVLYKDQVVVKKIPASATDYLVYVPNDDEATVQLDLYLWTDVYENVNNPDASLAYKTWLVPLSSSTDTEDRVTWHVDGVDQYSDVATLNLSYYGGTDYYVDVYLNSLTGAKIASLKGGDQYKKVGIDYGNYTLTYLYWFSDQNDNTAITEVGTIDKQTINGSEKDIWLVLNENRSDITMIVPHYGTSIDEQTKYAGISIKNVSEDGSPAIIYVDDQLIEAVCYLEDGSLTNLSTVDYLGEYTFYLPIEDTDVDEESITLVAKSPYGDLIEKVIDFTIIADSTVTWTIDGTEDSISE